METEFPTVAGATTPPAAVPVEPAPGSAEPAGPSGADVPSGADIPSGADVAGGAASAGGAPADDGRLLDALRQVIDPELMINVVDLGLVYSIVSEESKVKVEMTLTSPACPAGPQIVQQSKQALERLEGVSTAEIRLVLSPPWTPDRMTDEARDQLGIF